MNIELLLKYIGGKVTDQERESITLWLDQSPENMKEYLRLRKIQDITIWHEPPLTNTVQHPIQKTKIFSLKRTILEALKIAAVFIVAFVGFRYVYPEKQAINPIVMQTLHVPVGQRAELTLTDGTKVWLNAKTTLTFPNQFSGLTREVKMDGEGYFSVTSNKLKPFIVKTEKYDVRVFGTQFNLMTYSGKGIFETSLIEGAVEVMK
ncbi:MAG: FecR family protein, partial [Mariniphaga sp.]